MAGLDRSFVLMLRTTYFVEKRLDPDQWGNEQYAAYYTVPGMATVPLTSSLGTDDSHDKRQKTVVHTGGLMLNFVGSGVAPSDRIREGNAEGDPLVVESAQTFYDDKGEPLYQEVTVTSEPKG